MRKIVLICFLLISTPIVAGYGAQFLIKITNGLSTDCKLKNQIILFGHISDHTTIPTVVRPNQTVSFMMRSGPRYRSNLYLDKSILLTYECDTEQEITIYTSNNRSVDAKRFDIKNMWATYEIITPILQRSEIDWTLSY